MADLVVRIRSLTPLWTGGVGGTMDRLHETGILGSLRWWYEAIVRGLGNEACDSTSNDKCRYEENRGSPERQLCHACYVFGTTGWKRRFSLEIVEDQTRPIWTSSSFLNVCPSGRKRGWYLPPGRMGEFTLKLRGEDPALQQMASLLLFLEHWGHLGAKPQLGYGIFEIMNRQELLKWARGHRWNAGSGAPDERLPNLRRFGFFRYKFLPDQKDWWVEVPGLNKGETKTRVQQLVSNYNIVPVSPAFKNEWRFRRWQGNHRDEQWIFGTTRWRRDHDTVRVRSKIAVSWAYTLDGREWEVRGWAWLQEPTIAVNVWALLKDKDSWKSVLGQEGTWQGDPPGDWRERTVEKVLHLL